MRIHRFAGVLLVTCFAVATQPGCAAAAPATQPAAMRPAAPAVDRFEKTIAAFEKKDQQSPPAPGGTLFVGSSTFALWKDLEADFKEFHALNRGFGGSTIPEVLHYTARIVLPYKPATIVFYCGENDVSMGRSAEQVAADFRQFERDVHAALPQARIFFVSMKYSPVRAKWHAEFKRGNDLVRQFAAQTKNVQFIDIASALLGTDGNSREDLFLKDRLHMNRQGQEVCIPVIKKALGQK